MRRTIIKCLQYLVLFIICFSLSNCKVDANNTQKNKTRKLEIQNFSPDFGFPDTKVTLIGTYFHPLKDSNIIYLGKMRVNKIDTVYKNGNNWILVFHVPQNPKKGLIRVEIGNDFVQTDRVFYISKTYLTGEGYIFLFIGWGFVFFITIYCFYKVLTGKRTLD